MYLQWSDFPNTQWSASLSLFFGRGSWSTQRVTYPRSCGWSVAELAFETDTPLEPSLQFWTLLSVSYWLSVCRPWVGVTDLDVNGNHSLPSSSRNRHAHNGSPVWCWMGVKAVPHRVGKKARSTDQLSCAEWEDSSIESMWESGRDEEGARSRRTLEATPRGLCFCLNMVTGSLPYIDSASLAHSLSPTPTLWWLCFQF